MRKRSVSLETPSRKLDIEAAMKREYEFKLSSGHLFVREWSSVGTPVILVHGGPGMSGYMGSLAVKLTGAGKVIEYNQRGTVRSAQAGPFDLDQHARDLFELVKSYSTTEQKPIVIGHSWGAVLTLVFAAQFTAAAQAIVLISSGSFDEDGKTIQNKEIYQRLSSKDRARFDELKNELGEVLDLEKKSRVDKEFIDLITPVYNYDQSATQGASFDGRVFPASDESADSFAEYRKSGRLIELLKSISVPVAVFHGKNDVIPYSSVIPYCNANLKAGVSTVLDECGHFPWLEPGKSEQFLSLLKAYIAEQIA